MEISWSGSGVNGSGKNAAVTSGTAGTVTVTASAGGKTASYDVTFTDPEPAGPVVDSVSISGESSAEVGKSVQLTANLTMTSGNASDVTVTWSGTGVTGNGTTATVTSSSAGTVTATVSAGGKTATHTVTFTEPQPAGPVVSAIKITGATSAKTGEKVSLTAELTMSSGNAADVAVTWTADGGTLDTSKTPVTLTCAEEKTIKVTAKAQDKQAEITVIFSKAAVKVTKITLDQTALSLKTGESKALKATLEPADATDKTIKWSSSNTAVATVDDKGNVKAVAKGSADITAASVDGTVKAVCKVTVTDALSVTLEAPGSMKVGEEKQLKWTTIGDVDTSKTKVTSSDTKLATVDNNGKVKALAKGKVTIKVTVTDKNGKTAEHSAELEIKEADAIEVKLEPTALSLKVGDKVTVKSTVSNDGGKGVKWECSDYNILQIISSNEKECIVKALKPGTVKLKAVSNAKSEVTASCEVKVADLDMSAKLKDKSGNQMYVKDGENYREATVADYYNYSNFYRKQDNAQYRYTGWQNLDGKRYYFDKNGVFVTGDQIIQGMQYTFNSDGSLKVNAAFGIDVSKHNGNIDWNAVKNSGVEFVIIRCGYRGSATGVLVEDPKFKTNIQGAINAGLKVGIYFFSQAVNEVEAVEEASMTISLINKYKITYPVYIDVEAANGRGDTIDNATRTKVIRAYCQTLKNSGYTAGIYANKNWLETKFTVGELSSYKIWLAQYAAVPTYGGRYEMWQYSSTGRISGISGNVDLNSSYMTY